MWRGNGNERACVCGGKIPENRESALKKNGRGLVISISIN